MFDKPPFAGRVCRIHSCASRSPDLALPAAHRGLHQPEFVGATRPLVDTPRPLPLPGRRWPAILRPASSGPRRRPPRAWPMKEWATQARTGCKLAAPHASRGAAWLRPPHEPSSRCLRACRLARGHAFRAPGICACAPQGTACAPDGVAAPAGVLEAALVPVGAVSGQEELADLRRVMHDGSKCSGIWRGGHRAARMPEGCGAGYAAAAEPHTMPRRELVASGAAD